MDAGAVADRVSEGDDSLIELSEDALVKETEEGKVMRVQISAVTDDQIKTAEHVVFVADDEPKWHEQFAGRYVAAPLVPIVESHGATFLEIVIDRSDADALERLRERIRLLKGPDPHV